MPEREPRNVIESFFGTVYNVLEKPTVWFRESIVKPNQKSYPWYHQKFRRVPTIDECYTDDPVCFFEADCQYKRDKQVDSDILNILRQRFEDCTMYEAPDHIEKCTPLLRAYEEATTNWFTKYVTRPDQNKSIDIFMVQLNSCMEEDGDLGAYHNVKTAYMKQKHRMVWERRHGPVGSGMRNKNTEETTEES